MQKFLEDLSSPYFWLTAGFFALLVNIVSSYIKSPMDRAFGKRENQAARHQRRGCDSITETLNSLFFRSDAYAFDRAV